ALFLISVVITGQLGIFAPSSDPLRRVRGWQALSSDLQNHIEQHDVKTIIADRRVTAANLQWYFYQNPISVTVYDNDNYPSNHFELKYNYNSDSPSPIIALTQIPEAPDITGIEWIGLVGDSSQKISKNKNRNYFFYLGRN
ncbi:MAG: hypothetical protein HOI17_06065, partial [Alphaproteobacteria bacterium]|nr:hypothetical protein [Alphaproteobacteria bacterium]